MENRIGIEFTEGSSNVYFDLGLPNHEELYSKSGFGVKIIGIANDLQLTPRQQRRIMGISKRNLKLLRNARFHLFRAEQLEIWLDKIDTYRMKYLSGAVMFVGEPIYTDVGELHFDFVFGDDSDEEESEEGES